MNLPNFIASRISKAESKSFSSIIHKIAIASIGLGLAIMLIAFLILKGFENTIIDRIYNFSAHLQITKYTVARSFEEEPFNIQKPFFTDYQKYGYIDHMQEYSHKAGLIRTEEEVLGVVFKGVAPTFDTIRFGENMLEGRFIRFEEDDYSREVILSRRIADKMELSTGDGVIVHFFQDPPRVRRLTVTGIYETDLAEYYDDKIIIGDIGLVRRLNNWPDSLAGGIEVFVKNTRDVDEAWHALDYDVGHELYVERVKDKYIQVFEWLHLISRQVNIFLGIILIVISINMISIVLILIMERTRMIGLLKALGAGNGTIREIFSYTAMRLIARGLLIGNAFALGLCAIQYYFRPIKLNPQDYYMKFVPIEWHWEIIIGLNFITFIVILLILFLPTMVISRIDPIKSMKFD